ncbi:MAG: hypothetical protein HUJ68_10770 [Clostridia bacterium]|nr:hypothetical protein [Clostridia bacterium]
MKRKPCEFVIFSRTEKDKNGDYKVSARYSFDSLSKAIEYSKMFGYYYDLGIYVGGDEQKHEYFLHKRPFTKTFLTRRQELFSVASRICR